MKVKGEGGIRFISDSMLGKVARILRLAGYDTLYSDSWRDKEMIRIASKEKRVLLTRDRKLYQEALKKGLDAYLLLGDNPLSSIAELSISHGLKILFKPETSRCTICNGEVTQIEKRKVKGKVKRGTYENFDDFWQCKKCGQVYWLGSHWKKIKEEERIINKKILSMKAKKKNL